MSHLTTLRTAVRNVEALREALTRLGYRCTAGGAVADYYGHTRQVELAVELPGQRQKAVGFVRNGQTGLLDLVGDWWGSQVDRQQFLNNIKSAYAREQVMESLAAQGIDPSDVREVEEADGTIVFEVPLDDSQLLAMAGE